jgi:hypothetical protein
MGARTEGAPSYHLTARRLLDKESRDRIREQNARINSKYPRHQAWIERALDALANDDYSRMAFGVYLHADDQPGELCCSVIVTVNAFAPHLELKNLMVFDNQIPEGVSSRTFESECIRTITRHVQRFASNRGYRKLVTEVFRDDEQYRHMTQCLLACDFSVVGSQLDRYLVSDDVLYLAWDVRAVYGYDPFDHAAASRWIIESNLPDMRPADPIEMRLSINGGGQSIPLRALIFRMRLEAGAPAVKLGDEVALIVLSDFLARIHKIQSVDGIEFVKEFDGRFLVFDFGNESESSTWARQLVELLTAKGARVESLSRDELMQLLYDARPNNRAKRRLDSLPRYSDVDGLVTLSDPFRFDRARVRSIFQQKALPVYIKLGPKGRFLRPGQYLLMSYFDASAVNPELWGLGLVHSISHYDLAKLEASPGASQAHVLFGEIAEDGDDDDGEPVPIWDEATFEKHNGYNATNEVVCIQLATFTDFRDHRIPLTELAKDRYRLDFLAKEYDAYLTREEVKAILERVREFSSQRRSENLHEPVKQSEGMPAEIALGMGGSVATLCIHSYSDRDTRLQSDGQVVDDALRDRVPFKRVVLENLATSVRISDAMRREHPHVLHVGAHCDGESIVARGPDGQPEQLGTAYWRRVFFEGGAGLQVIVLCCCNSAGLGRVLSGNGRVSVSIAEPDLPDNSVLAFVKFFYDELSKRSGDGSALEVVQAIIANWSSTPRAFVPLVAFDGLPAPL